MNPADFQIQTGTISPTLAHPSSATLVQRSVPSLSTKTTFERVNVEPIYTALKNALGDSWAEYKAALSAFVLGGYNLERIRVASVGVYPDDNVL